MTVKKFLWFTWKDLQHPQAGGAEVVNEEIAKRLVEAGHQVTFIVGGFEGGANETKRNGYKIIRLGGKYSLYNEARKYYKANLEGWADLVIDEMNTIPFFCKYYVKEKCILFVHQLCRKVWFYQMRFPFNLIGYLLEPMYLRALSDQSVITVSESTKKDLMRYKFKEENIHIISEGIQIEPVEKLEDIRKYSTPTILSLGALRAMKRTDQIIKAFEIARKDNPLLRLYLAGDATGNYGEKILKQIDKSPARDFIHYLGRVRTEKKKELMQRSHVIVVTSVKEGWGLIVTEANSQGTPAIVYNVDGLRDSVQNNKTGIVSNRNTPSSLAGHINDLLKDRQKYQRFRKKGWEWSKTITFDRCYADFVHSVKKLIPFT